MGDQGIGSRVIGTAKQADKPHKYPVGRKRPDWPHTDRQKTRTEEIDAHKAKRAHPIRKKSSGKRPQPKGIGEDCHHYPQMKVVSAELAHEERDQRREHALV